MPSPHDRAALVLAEAWRLLPPIKHEAPLVDIILTDLGATHGSYTPSTGVLRLSRHLFTADPLGTRRLFDLNGDDPARTTPYCERDAHTVLHELSHAIGAGTGLDEAPGWLALSEWVENWDDPQGTGRYHELRPGWVQEVSSWRYRLGTWFPRAYASKSPQECFADCVAALCLGWASAYGPAAAPKFAWLRRHVFGEVKAQALQAASARWRTVLDTHLDAALSPAQREARWLRTAARTLTDDLGTTLAQWRGQWLATLPTLAPAHGVGWLPVAPLAEDLAQTMRPAMNRLWGQLTQTSTLAPSDLLVRPVVTFARTTMRHIAAAIAPVLTHGPQAIAEALDAAYADALATRLPLLVESLTRHAVQGAARAGALLDGATHATWRTTSGHPCPWCADLEGQTFALTSTPLWAEGEVLTNSAGQGMTLDYEDIYHPPIHLNCACILEYH